WPLLCRHDEMAIQNDRTTMLLSRAAERGQEKLLKVIGLCAARHAWPFIAGIRRACAFLCNELSRHEVAVPALAVQRSGQIRLSSRREATDEHERLTVDWHQASPAAHFEAEAGTGMQRWQVSLSSTAVHDRKYRYLIGWLNHRAMLADTSSRV